MTNDERNAKINALIDVIDGAASDALILADECDDDDVRETLTNAAYNGRDFIDNLRESLA